VPKANLTDDFRHAVEHVFRSMPSRHLVNIGPFVAELAFRDASIADVFLSAFPAGPVGRAADFAFAIHCDADAALDSLVPDSSVHGYSMVDERFYALWQPLPSGWLHVHDFSARRGFSWVPKREAFEAFRARPMLQLIHANVAYSPWAPIHAGAVSLGGKTLVLAGPAGSGKSTAAIACAAAGWTYAGDDYVLVSAADRLVQPIYASARLRPGSVGALSNFVDQSCIAVSDDDDPRHELRLGGNYTANAIAGGRAVAILLPRRTGAKTITFRPARPVEAFYAVASITLAQTYGMHDTLKPKLTTLIRSVPTFVVDTADDPQAIPDAFASFLDRL